MEAFFVTLQLAEVWILILLSVAFYTLLERKVMGLIQLRRGPNKVGVIGVAQPFADALKLMAKTNSVPKMSMGLAWATCPLITLSMSLIIWMILPGFGLISWGMDLFVFMCYLSVASYPLMFSGWFSNSKYSLIGCIRSVILNLSYEIPLGFVILSVMIAWKCPSFFIFLEYSGGFTFLSQMGLVFMFLLVMMVECGRTPFDLSEAESELVSGFNVEFGGSLYVLIFLSEYCSLFFSGMCMGMMFFNGSIFWILVLVGFAAWVRATFPRIRFDKLMSTGWVVLTPISMSLMSLNVIMT